MAIAGGYRGPGPISPLNSTPVHGGIATLGNPNQRVLPPPAGSTGAGYAQGFSTPDSRSYGFGGGGGMTPQQSYRTTAMSGMAPRPTVLHGMDDSGMAGRGRPVLNTAPPANGGMGRPMTPGGGGVPAGYGGPRPVLNGGGMQARSLPPQNAPGMGMRMPPGRGPGPMMGQPGMNKPPMGGGMRPGVMPPKGLAGMRPPGVPAPGGGVNPQMIAAANAARWRTANGRPQVGTPQQLTPMQQQGVDAANAARWQAAQPNRGPRNIGPPVGAAPPANGVSAVPPANPFLGAPMLGGAPPVTTPPVNMANDALTAPNAVTTQGLAAMGRNGDTQLAHVNDREAMMLQAQGGSGTINPQTGLREFWGWGGGSSETTGGTGDSSIGDDFSWSGTPTIDMGGGSDTTIDLSDSLPGGSGGYYDDVSHRWVGDRPEEEWEPSLASRVGWGLAGTVLTMNPMLGIAAARYGPEAWHGFTNWLGGLNSDQQSIAGAQLQRDLADERHISGQNATDFLSNAQRAVSDAETQRGLSQGSDNNQGVRSGQANSGFTPSRSASSSGSGSGGSGTNGPTTIPPPPPPEPRHVIPFQDGQNFLSRYGERDAGERLWFDRFF